MISITLRYLGELTGTRKERGIFLTEFFDDLQTKFPSLVFTDLSISGQMVVTSLPTPTFDGVKLSMQSHGVEAQILKDIQVL